MAEKMTEYGCTYDVPDRSWPGMTETTPDSVWEARKIAYDRGYADARVGREMTHEDVRKLGERLSYPYPLFWYSHGHTEGQKQNRAEQVE